MLGTGVMAPMDTALKKKLMITNKAHLAMLFILVRTLLKRFVWGFFTLWINKAIRLLKKYWQKKFRPVQHLQNSAFRKQFLHLSSDYLSNTVIHECSHANQMNNGVSQHKQASFSDFGDNLTQKEEFFVRFLQEGKRNGSTLSREQQIIGRSEEVIAEAGVMAQSYVGFLALNPDDETIKWVNQTYNCRLSSEHQLSAIPASLRAEMFATKGGKYTPKAQQMQYACARHVFNAVLQDFGQQQMKKIDAQAQVDYNHPDCFQWLKASYFPDVFGAANDYINSIPASLRDDNKNQLNTNKIATTINDLRSKTINGNVSEQIFHSLFKNTKSSSLQYMRPNLIDRKARE